MKNPRFAFNLLDRDDHDSVGYKEITCHLLFDFIVDLTRKSRYVAVWHIINPPFSMSYVSVVSRYCVRLVFLIAVLNDLDILAREI